MACNWGSYSFEYSENLEDFFFKIWKSDIDGRNLELFMPLFLTAGVVDGASIEEIVKIAVSEVGKKASDDAYENRDTGLLMAISSLNSDEFIKVSEIVSRYVEEVGEEKERRDGSIMRIAPKWLNSKWVGRAIRRMNISQEKRRMAGGVEIRVDFSKVQRKLQILGAPMPESKPKPDLLDEFAAQKIPERAG